MQFHPRSIARNRHARIRNWAKSKEAKPLGFVGYKVGMTHLQITDNRQTSLTKGTDIFCPVTVIEVPPIKVASIVFYKNNQIVSHVLADSVDKEMERKILASKKKGKEAAEFDSIRLSCYTQPKLSGLGKKKPETIEIAVGGTKEQQLIFAKDKLGKEIRINEVFKEGQLTDIHAVTRGKGFQGAMRRFGVTLRHHKSEKSRRNQGSLGAWRGQGHIMWRTAHAGKMGNHLRTEYNKWLVKIGTKPEEINVKGGFIGYGLVKSQYILVKGSIAGADNRLITLTDPMRQKKISLDAPTITYTSQESKQGR